jgi:hypothetical protein
VRRTHRSRAGRQQPHARQASRAPDTRRRVSKPAVQW